MADKDWEKEKKENYGNPTLTTSPVHFGYRVRSVTLALPYCIVGPMAWEYLYQHGQAQEDLPDHLTMASLYEMWVVRPGYQSAFHRSATVERTQATCNHGETYWHHFSDIDLNKDAWPVGFTGEAEQGCTTFICPQLECSVVGGMPFYFATLEQWAAHWNTFHVSVTPDIPVWCAVARSRRAQVQMHWMPCFITLVATIPKCVTMGIGMV